MLASMKTTLLLAAICAVSSTNQPPESSTPMSPFVIHAPDGSAEISIDTSKAPDMKDWAEQKLAPVLAEWYPKISAMLPTPGFTPPKKWSVVIAPGNGVAATGGTRVTATATWFRGQLDKQAVGALLHEEVHVVQQYGGGRRTNAPGSFSNGDITNLVALTQKLRNKSDAISVFVDSQLTSSERKAMADYRGPGPAAYRLRTNLVGALNRIVAGPAIYNESLFKNVALRESTTSSLNDKPDGSDLARLNRALLEDAFPDELAHRGGGRNRGNTGWLTEGIPDYIRWFLYEPKSHGAGATYIQGRIDSDAKKGKVYEPKYSDSYRVSANFLNFVTTEYDRHFITKLNNALRQGQYYEDIWADNTGKTLQELNEEWLAVVHKQLAKLKPRPAVPPARATT
jgi:Peptidase of plants and bacteria